MTIKSDRWIREMALEHGMIEPFADRRVRAGVISFGLSSYGYDMRVADEFRIFHNAISQLVDPKEFDERSFIEVQAESCIIPPNSFALARSVEYFRIPRNVLTICVGKSTYARCFRGDTRVALVDGTTRSLEQLAKRAGRGERFWGYSLGRFGRIIVTELEAPRYIGRDPLLEIELDNGRTIACTPDHEFVRRDGRRAQASNLRPRDSLMPLYRKLVRGYEAVYQPLNGHLYPTHQLADEWNLRNGVYGDVPGTHRHHRDGDRRNNNPWNIERLDTSEHIRLHNEETYGDGFDGGAHGKAIRESRRARARDPEWRERFSKEQRRRALRFWHDDEYAAAREELVRRHLENWTPQRRAAQREAMQRQYSDPENRPARSIESRRAWAADPGDRRMRQRELARQLRLRSEISAESVRAALEEAGSFRGAARLLGCDRSVFRRSPRVTEAWRRKNHRIVAIRALPGEHDVFCLTAPEAGNFALAAGVFVSNCGIITNVTPFEPEWEGYVTLEISNTTPLPAKIYANEGIAQVLFFESDEPCQVSYADKKGKYQRQAGVTPPRL